MKIKVAIIDKDVEYLNRLTAYFQQKYIEKMEVYAFTELESYKEFNKDSSCNIILCDTSFEFGEGEKPENSTLVYLVDSENVESYNGEKVIGKYQKVSLIYKELLSIASESVSNVLFRSANAKIRSAVFISPQGGTGATTVAAAFAMQKAKMGLKVFYLSLEKLGNPELFFEGSNNTSLSDVLFNIKSKKTNLIMKMESSVQTDSTGIDFFRTCKNPNDMLEMTLAEQETLVKNTMNVKDYDYLVIDMDYTLDDKFKQIITEFAEKVVIVSDGTAIANDKLMKCVEIFRVWEQKYEIDLFGKTYLLYNRFSSTRGMQVDGLPVKTLGGIPRIESPDPKMIAMKISEMAMFQEL